MNTTERRLMWHSIVAMTVAQDSKTKEGQTPSKFIVLQLEEKTDNPFDITVGKGCTKVVFSTTHSVAFRKLAEAKEKGINPNVYGSFHSMPTNPYYPKDKAGNYFKDEHGNPRIAQRVTFFLFSDEDVMTALRQACRNLEWCPETTQGTDAGDNKAAVLTGGKTVEQLIAEEAARLAAK